MGLGLADKLGLHKASTFVATITLHELAQVPLKTGRFRCKWKFKHATSQHAAPDRDDHDGALRALLHPRNALAHSSAHASGQASRNRSRSGSPASRYTDSHDESTGTDRSGSGSATTVRSFASRVRSRSPPAASRSPDQTPNPNKTPTAGHSFAGFSTTTPFASEGQQAGLGSSRSNVYGHEHSSSVDEPGPRVGRRGGGDFGHSIAVQNKGDHAEPKGTTSLIYLQNHSLNFNRVIQCPVSIPLRPATGSSRLLLQPSPVRLMIRQEVPEGYGHKSEVEKTGEITLDLAQFVGTGKGVDQKARRYLLRECKVNATFKLTVKMEWVGGEPNFVAPALKSGLCADKVPSTNVSTAANSSRASLNRSSSSLGDRKGSGSTGRLNRVHSSSTVSTYSVNSARSSSVPGSQPGHGHKRGWHPSHTALDQAPGASLLAGANPGNERAAADIIDSFFNPPVRPAHRPHLPKAASAGGRGLDSSTDDSDLDRIAHALDFNPAGRATPRPRPRIVAGLQAGEPARSSAPATFVGRSASPAGPGPRPEMPGRQATALSSGSNSSVVSAGSSVRPSRRPSLESEGSRSRSVRWGDDSPAGSGTASPVQGLGVSTSASSSPYRTNSNISQSSARFSSLLKQPSNASLRSLPTQDSSSSVRSTSSILKPSVSPSPSRQGERESQPKRPVTTSMHSPSALSGGPGGKAKERLSASPAVPVVAGGAVGAGGIQWTNSFA